jgi:hypothetical protein
MGIVLFWSGQNGGQIVDWTELLQYTDGNWSNCSQYREYQHSPSLRYLLMEAWIHFNESGL